MALEQFLDRDYEDVSVDDVAAKRRRLARARLPVLRLEEGPLHRLAGAASDRLSGPRPRRAARPRSRAAAPPCDRLLLRRRPRSPAGYRSLMAGGGGFREVFDRIEAQRWDAIALIAAVSGLDARADPGPRRPARLGRLPRGGDPRLAGAAGCRSRGADRRRDRRLQRRARDAWPGRAPRLSRPTAPPRQESLGDRVERAIDAAHRRRRPRSRAARPSRRRAGPSIRRTAFWLLVTGVSLYLVAPSLLDVLGSWQNLQPDRAALVPAAGAAAARLARPACGCSSG